MSALTYDDLVRLKAELDKPKMQNPFYYHLPWDVIVNDRSYPLYGYRLAKCKSKAGRRTIKVRYVIEHQRLIKDGECFIGEGKVIMNSTTKSHYDKWLGSQSNKDGWHKPFKLATNLGIGIENPIFNAPIYRANVA